MHLSSAYRNSVYLLLGVNWHFIFFSQLELLLGL